MQSERRSLEEEYEDLRNKKESIAQWEAQITEIIQWSVWNLYWVDHKHKLSQSLTFVHSPSAKELKKLDVLTWQTNLI